MTMELRDYLRVYWRQRWLIAGLVTIATITTVILTINQPVRFQASESFAVNRINKELTADYQYDGYYALQAADLFSQTVVSWFSTPSILRQVYRQADLDPNIETMNSLSSRFTVKRYSAQNIVVRFNETSAERATKLAQAVRQVIEQQTSELNKTADGKSIFSIVGSEPVIVDFKPNPWLYGGVALVVSFGFSLLLAAFRHYLQTG